MSFRDCDVLFCRLVEINTGQRFPPSSCDRCPPRLKSPHLPDFLPQPSPNLQLKTIMALERVANIVLRLAQLVFAAIVAGITGWYLHKSDQAGVSSWDVGRFIYTEVVAALSILVALLWLLPFSSAFIHWPFDFFMSILWFVAFGLLVDVRVSVPAPGSTSFLCSDDGAKANA
jgi:hypothetical protein